MATRNVLPLSMGPTTPEPLLLFASKLLISAWVHSSPLLRRPGLQPRRKPPQNNSSPNPLLRPNPRTGDFNRHERLFPLFSLRVAYPFRFLLPRHRWARVGLLFLSLEGLAYPRASHSGDRLPIPVCPASRPSTPSTPITIVSSLQAGVNCRPASDAALA